MYEYKEKSYLRSYLGWTAPFLAAYAVGFGLGYLNGSSDDPGEKKIQEAQIHNEQIYTQLESEVTPIQGLILKTSDETFEFQTQTQTGQAETCSGEYEVKDDVAVAVGELACTQTSPIGK